MAKNSKKELRAKAVTVLLLQANRLAEIAKGLDAPDSMLAIDLQGIEANIRQVVEGLQPVRTNGGETEPNGEDV